MYFVTYNPWLADVLFPHPVSIDSIREVCEGKQSEIFQRYAEGSFDPNCCFSLYYGEHMESLDLVSGTGEEARTWITGLKYLMAGISDEDSLAKRQRTRDQYPAFLYNADVTVTLWICITLNSIKSNFYNCRFELHLGIV